MNPIGSGEHHRTFIQSMAMISLPKTLPNDWLEAQHALLEDMLEYAQDPEPRSRASILTARLTEAIDQSDSDSFRQIGVHVLAMDIYGRGSTVGRWAIRKLTQQEPPHPSELYGMAACAPDNVIDESLESLKQWIEDNETANWGTCLAALRIASKVDINFPIADQMARCDAEALPPRLAAQSILIDHWFTQDARRHEGASLLENLYDVSNVFQRTQMLNAITDAQEGEVALLPVIAKQHHTESPIVHVAMAHACGMINAPEAEPILERLLKSTDVDVAHHAAHVAGQVGTRRIIETIKQRAKAMDEKSDKAPLMRAITEIEMRHPAQNIEVGALSLSEVPGTSGALSLSAGEHGALSIEDQIDRQITNTAVLKSDENNTLQLWQRLAFRDRVAHKERVASKLTMVGQRKPLIINMSLLVFCTVGIIAFQNVANGLVWMLGLVGLIVGLINQVMLSRKTEESKRLVNIIEDGTFALAVPARRDNPLATETQIICTDAKGKSHLRQPNHVPAALNKESLPVVIPKHDEDDVVFLSELPLTLNQQGQLTTSPMWSVVLFLTTVVTALMMLINLGALALLNG